MTTEASDDWASGWMDVDEAIDAWLDRVHPMVYGFDDLRNYVGGVVLGTADERGRLPDGRIVLDRYQRCPTCEEWAPCTVRSRIEELLPVDRRRSVQAGDLGWRGLVSAPTDTP